MRRGEIFGEPEPGFPAIWGAAAWAQTQLTPGVSTLAAPHPRVYPWRQARMPRMKMSHQARMAGVLTGFGGLLAGLFLLDREPLFGVLAILGAMALLLESLSRSRESSNTN